MRQWEEATWAAGVKESEVIARVGAAVALRLLQLTKPGDAIVALAGKGHNGDDARAAAPHLTGRRLILIDVADPVAARSEFAQALKQSPAWILDGLFGIGLNRPLEAGWRDFIKAINAAIALDRAEREKRSELAELKKRYNFLTPREREVLPFVVAGFANKVTAAELGTSEITIGVHRGQIMRKMGAKSLAELVRMADRLGIAPAARPA